jgi:hypothetical protein
MNGTTTHARLQENSVNTTLLFNTIRQHAGDIESETYTAIALAEIASEKMDALSEAFADKVVLETVTHVGALAAAIRRSLQLIQDALPAISLALTDAEGGAV